MNNTVYSTLSNGLTVCLTKKPGYREKQAMLAFRCGSVNTCFEYGGARHTVPAGTAHFVEHKMFEKKHGNIFDDFAKLGANVNAFTGLDITAYYFTCTDSFEATLSLLAQLASTTHFTRRGVEKERDIISSEVTMYDDDPGWQSYFGMLGGLYREHPVRCPIAGDTEQISNITAEALQLFYDSFYTADNAILTAAGDIDEDSFFEQAEKEFVLKPTSDVKRCSSDKSGIESVYVKKPMSIASPVFSIGFKENDFDIPPVMRIISSKALMDIIAGKSSVLYEKLYAEGMCSNPPAIDYICGRDFGVSVISGTSRSPEQLLSRLNGEIENFLNYGISEKNLNRIICKSLGRLETSMDSPDFCCSFAADNFVKYINADDFADAYKNLTTEKLAERLSSHFRADNLCMSEAVPV